MVPCFVASAQNGAPIGDADSCGADSRNVSFPLAATFGNHLACLNSDPEALEDSDDKTVPQLKSRVEYATRLASRTIEFLRLAKSKDQHFFIGVGIRKCVHSVHCPPHNPTCASDSLRVVCARHHLLVPCCGALAQTPPALARASRILGEV